MATSRVPIGAKKPNGCVDVVEVTGLQTADSRKIQDALRGGTCFPDKSSVRSFLEEHGSCRVSFGQTREVDLSVV